MYVNCGKCIPEKDGILNFCYSLTPYWESYIKWFLKAGFQRAVERTYKDTGAKSEKEKVPKGVIG